MKYTFIYRPVVMVIKKYLFQYKHLNRFTRNSLDKLKQDNVDKIYYSCPKLIRNSCNAKGPFFLQILKGKSIWNITWFKYLTVLYTVSRLKLFYNNFKYILFKW